MSYATLIAQIRSKTEGEPASLADLLWHIDALDKSVPSLPDLNIALEENELTKVSEADYEAAMAANQMRMIKYLEAQGISGEQIKEATMWLHERIGEIP